MLILGTVNVGRDGMGRDLPVALLLPLAIGALALDGRLGRLDGVVLLVLFLAWLGAVVVEARRQRSAAGAVLGESRHGLAVGETAAGLVLLVTASRSIVTGAEAIALDLGLEAFVVGATLVALGTSVPELATAVIARLRGHDEVGLGTILGSNIFNGLAIVGTVALVRPIAVTWESTAVALGFGLITVAMIFPGRATSLGRRPGLLLLLSYGVYVVAVLEGGY